jgi:hypothetical protein
MARFLIRFDRTFEGALRIADRDALVVMMSELRDHDARILRRKVPKKSSSLTIP